MATVSFSGNLEIEFIRNPVFAEHQPVAVLQIVILSMYEFAYFMHLKILDHVLVYLTHLVLMKSGSF